MNFEWSAFNKRIADYKTKSQNPLFAEVVNIVVARFKGGRIHLKNYYYIFDSVLVDIGVHFNVIPYYKDEYSEKVIGYLPLIRYCDNNKINQEPREEYLVDRNNFYKSERKCWAFLAKELVYMLMRVDDLEEKLDEKKY
jgi:hypothetical protein